jgi:CRP-like cAMP-binding protein
MSSYERIINNDGEVGYFVPETSKAVIRTPQEIERAKHFATLPKKKRFHHGRNYFVSYNDAVSEIVRDLTLIEAGALVKLLLTLKLKGEGRVASSKTELSRILGRAKSSSGAIVDRLMDIGVLEYDGEYYCINAKYHTMGDTVAGELFTKVYTVRAREMIDGLKLNEIGMLYKIIPFFHYSEYYLCVDSNTDKAFIDYMGREGLANAIGHDVSTVSKIMSKLQSVGALLVTGSHQEVRYLVHPDLMFRQAEGVETEWTKAVRKLFEDHRKKARK